MKKEDWIEIKDLIVGWCLLFILLILAPIIFLLGCVMRLFGIKFPFEEEWLR